VNFVSSPATPGGAQLVETIQDGKRNT